MRTALCNTGWYNGDADVAGDDDAGDADGDDDGDDDGDEDGDDDGDGDEENVDYGGGGDDGGGDNDNWYDWKGDEYCMVLKIVRTVDWTASWKWWELLTLLKLR